MALGQTPPQQRFVCCSFPAQPDGILVQVDHLDTNLGSVPTRPVKFRRVERLYPPEWHKKGELHFPFDVELSLASEVAMLLESMVTRSCPGARCDGPWQGDAARRSRLTAGPQAHQGAPHRKPRQVRPLLRHEGHRCAAQNSGWPGA